MGNIIRRSNVMSGPSGLKLESQRIVDFSEKVKDWQKWKNCTQCTFDGSGYEKVLSNQEHADRMRNQNRHDKDKAGHAAWHSLIKWFDGDVLKAKTADTVRARLESYKLGNGTTAS
eukprot:15324633-Ditylum_brightwellii.AAC.1